MGDRGNVTESKVPGIRSKDEDSDSQEAAHDWGQILATRREGGLAQNLQKTMILVWASAIVEVVRGKRSGGE